jgi:phenylalanyl-tRNA synthetase alpha chain
MHNFNIEDIKSQLNDELNQARTLEDTENLRVKYLGRKGIIAHLTTALSELELEQKRLVGKEVNALKQHILSSLESKENELKQTNVSSSGKVDIGLPGITSDLGHAHPLTQTTQEICNVFMRLGFSVVEGPEIETEYNNFTGLNIPLEHPSRDVFDTFYIKSQHPTPNTQHLLLRSHTSPVQIRVMQSQKPPLAVVVPGKVYRPDATDASHSFMFHQIEGFVVDKEIRFSDLKGVLTVFARNVFGPDIRMRFRPHFFPFTEPSAEVDISCIICKGKGCSVCGRKGWLEILGAGMIHPRVFKNVGYDPNKHTGFAFGMGVERITMLKYGINDIRLFFENDLRFLRQF